jgi:cell division septal protein FtsQ
MSSILTLRSRKSERGEALLSRLLWTSVVVLAAALLAILAVRLAGSPVAAVKRVILESDLPGSEREILSAAGLSGGASWWTVDCNEVRARLEENPQILRARVSKVFPNTVRLSVFRREPVALMLGQAGGRSVPVLVDSEGVIVKVCSEASEADLPVLSGVSVADARPGTRLPRSLRSLLGDLKRLKDRSPALFRLISEIGVVPVGDDDYELVFYPLSSPVRVRVRRALDEAQLKYTLMVLDLLQDRGILQEIGEIDFRGEEAVYTLKEGRSL